MRITVDTSTLDPYVAAELLLAELAKLCPVPLIALCGPAGCGKSTIARVLDGENLRVRSFAGPLKQMLRALGLTEQQVSGDLKETPCELLCGNTPRYGMQTLGTQWGRDLIGPDVWVNAALANLPAAPIVTIIDDCRFANEALAVRARGGVVIELVRGGIAYSGRHESEAGLSRELIDAQVANNGDALNVVVAVLGAVLEVVQARRRVAETSGLNEYQSAAMTLTSEKGLHDLWGRDAAMPDYRATNRKEWWQRRQSELVQAAKEAE